MGNNPAEKYEILTILYNAKGRLGCPYCRRDITPSPIEVAEHRLSRTGPGMPPQHGRCGSISVPVVGGCGRYFKITDKAVFEINEIWDKLQGLKGDPKLLQIYLDSVDEIALDGSGRIVDKPEPAEEVQRNGNLLIPDERPEKNAYGRGTTRGCLEMPGDPDDYP